MKGINRKRKGLDYERKIVRQLKSLGYMAARSAGSHSPIDVWAIHPQQKIVRLIQCKTGTAYSEKKEQEILDALNEFNGQFIVKVEVRGE